MKQIVDKTGRFAYRPFYEDGELDAICEAAITEYMIDRAGKLILPIPTDRLVSLIERDAAELDVYTDLTSEGPDVQGLTTFKPGAHPTVAIDQSLQTGGREHRYRTTLAHEWGHVKLHDQPFQAKRVNRSLFADSDDDTVKCKRDAIVGARQSDWMEWQAGYVCGALLMPKTHLLVAFHQYCDRYHCHGRVIEGTGYPSQIAEHLSRSFQVSQDAATVRLRQLGLILPKSPQESLL